MTHREMVGDLSSAPEKEERGSVVIYGIQITGLRRGPLSPPLPSFLPIGRDRAPEIAPARHRSRQPARARGSARIRLVDYYNEHRVALAYVSVLPGNLWRAAAAVAVAAAVADAVLYRGITSLSLSLLLTLKLCLRDRSSLRPYAAFVYSIVRT